MTQSVVTISFRVVCNVQNISPPTTTHALATPIPLQKEGSEVQSLPFAESFAKLATGGVNTCHWLMLSVATGTRGTENIGESTKQAVLPTTPPFYPLFRTRPDCPCHISRSTYLMMIPFNCSYRNKNDKHCDTRFNQCIVRLTQHIIVEGQRSGQSSVRLGQLSIRLRLGHHSEARSVHSQARLCAESASVCDDHDSALTKRHSALTQNSRVAGASPTTSPSGDLIPTIRGSGAQPRVCVCVC
jgi:hypothetical protein